MMAAAKIFGDMRRRGIAQGGSGSEDGSGGFDRSGRAQSLRLAPQYGITIVYPDESYGAKDTDMTAQPTKIRDTDAQAILTRLCTGPAIVTKNVRWLG